MTQLVILEAATIGLPDLESPEILRGFVEDLISLSELLQTEQIDLRISTHATQALFDAKRFPSAQEISDLLAQHAVVEVDGPTVARVAYRLLEIIPTLEDELGISDTLVDKLSIAPLSALQGMRAELLTDRQHCICIASAWTQAGAGNGPCVCVLRGTNVRSVSVEMVLVDIDCHSLIATKLGALPLEIRQELATAGRPGLVLTHIDPIGFWTRATTEAQLWLAIDSAIARERLVLPDVDAVQVRLHAGFFQNTRTCIRSGGGEGLTARILRAITECALNQNMAATHALRSSAAPTAPQIVRGNDDAMRRDVDYEFHLHYWNCGDGTIEIVSVAPHNSFTIAR